MAYAPDRLAALAKLHQALASSRLLGIPTNLEQLTALTIDPTIMAGTITTQFLGGFTYIPRLAAVVSAGTQTMVQDWPGRVGLWHVGVPPSGPMDALSHRLANALVGNGEEAGTLEVTLHGRGGVGWRAVFCRAGRTSELGQQGRARVLLAGYNRATCMEI